MLFGLEVQEKLLGKMVAYVVDHRMPCDALAVVPFLGVEPGNVQLHEESFLVV